MNSDNCKIKINKRELLQCALKKQLVKDDYDKECRDVLNKINNKCHYYPVNSENILEDLDLYPSVDSLSSSIKIDYLDFLKLICNSLDMDTSEIDFTTKNEDSINKLFYEKSQKLKTIYDFKTFNREFPTLYNFYDKCEKDIFNSSTKINKKIKIEENKAVIFDLYNKGYSKNQCFGNHKIVNETPLRYNSDTFFCERQADLFYRMFKHKNDLKEIFNDNCINIDLFNNEKYDNDKLLVYLLSKYIDKVKDLEGKDREDLIKLIKDNINNVKDHSTSVFVGRVKVSYEDILNDFNKILAGKQSKTVFLNEDILTTGKSNSKNNNSNGNIKKLTIDEKNYLIQKNQELIDFYENSGYIGKIVVKNGVEGDIAFVYANGEILVDYIAPDHSDANLKKLDKGRGIYHLNIHNFKNYIGTDRMTLRKKLRKDSPYSKVYANHTKNWQKRARDMIDEGLSNDFNEMQSKYFLYLLENEKVDKSKKVKKK